MVVHNESCTRKGFSDVASGLRAGRRTPLSHAIDVVASGLRAGRPLFLPPNYDNGRPARRPGATFVRNPGHNQRPPGAEAGRYLATQKQPAAL